MSAGSLGAEAACPEGLLQQHVLQTPDFLVMEYCGEDLAHWIKRSEGAERAALLGRVVDELAEFHRAPSVKADGALRRLERKMVDKA